MKVQIGLKTYIAGCDSIITINLSIDTVNTDVLQNTNTLTAIASIGVYQWIDCNNGNLPIPGETNQSFIALSNGNYAVIITNGLCVDTSGCYTISNMGFENVFNSQEIIVFPNPGNEFVTIQSNEEMKNATIKITDIVGKNVFLKNNISGNIYMLDLSMWENGVYLIEVIQEGYSSFIKILKK